MILILGVGGIGFMIGVFAMGFIYTKQIDYERSVAFMEGKEKVWDEARKK